MKAEITVDGQPVGKGRPRFMKKENFVRAYTPQKTADYEEYIRTVYKLKAKDNTYRVIYFSEETPLCISIRAYYKITINNLRK